MTATIRCDDAEVVCELGQHGFPHSPRHETAMDQHNRSAGSALLAIERRPVHLDRAASPRRHVLLNLGTPTRRSYPWLELLVLAGAESRRRDPGGRSGRGP